MSSSPGWAPEQGRDRFGHESLMWLTNRQGEVVPVPTRPTWRDYERRMRSAIRAVCDSGGYLDREALLWAAMQEDE